ncbi:hypothetical protein [Longimicrobium sp.]|uniref:hypothetical protein n=1 Tax=Longimicrobium sp. TaxID=2029185 RepID=UPI002CB765B1|nr:hypothetical protein [Longimicrobium sp.]HSU15185.1 hypothetical protein [Longimicrobium sp.]
MIHTTAQPQPQRASARPVPCSLDRHMGPFESIPELDGWLGADWCVCRSCRSTLTTWTALRQRSAA